MRCFRACLELARRDASPAALDPGESIEELRFGARVRLLRGRHRERRRRPPPRAAGPARTRPRHEGEAQRQRSAAATAREKPPGAGSLRLLLLRRQRRLRPWRWPAASEEVRERERENGWAVPIRGPIGECHVDGGWFGDRYPLKLLSVSLATGRVNLHFCG